MEFYTTQIKPALHRHRKSVGLIPAGGQTSQWFVRPSEMCDPSEKNTHHVSDKVHRPPTSSNTSEQILYNGIFLKSRTDFSNLINALATVSKMLKKFFSEKFNMNKFYTNGVFLNLRCTSQVWSMLRLRYVKCLKNFLVRKSILKILVLKFWTSIYWHSTRVLHFSY